MGKFLFTFVSVSSVILIVYGAPDPEMRCTPPEPGEQVLYYSDFRWNQSFEEMGRRFEKLYSSRKRLWKRAYFDRSRGNFVVPIETNFNGQEDPSYVPTRIHPRFIRSVTRHIENALKRLYVDYVFFSDMGHAHFLIPRVLYRRKYSDLTSRYPAFYREIMADPAIKFLYHTAEQLKMSEGPPANFILIHDRHLLWRYFTRNLVGDNAGGEELDIFYTGDDTFNRLDALDGYRYWGAGFSISANKRGCFPYQSNGKTYYFDLSFKSLPMNPNANTGLY